MHKANGELCEICLCQTVGIFYSRGVVRRHGVMQDTDDEELGNEGEGSASGAALCCPAPT